MAGLTYMQRRPSGIYEFRKRLPQELAGKPAAPHVRNPLSELINPKTGNFKQFLTISLKTTNIAQAKREDVRQAARIMDLFAQALVLVRAVSGKTEPLSGALPAVGEIEADIYRGLLHDDEVEREQGDARRYMQTPKERAEFGPDLEDPLFGELGMTETHFELLGDLVAEHQADYRKALARRDIKIVKGETNLYLEAKGIPVDPSSTFYREAAVAVLKAHVKAYDTIAQRQAGDDIPTPPPLPTASTGLKLSQAFALWKAGSQTRGGKKPAASTVAEADRGMRYFIQWHGDLALSDITKEKARDFRNALARIPKRLSAKQRAMPLRKLLATLEGGPSLELMHGASVNKHLNLMVAIISAAEREGMLDAIPGFTNPFAKLGLAIDRRNDPNRRKPFSEADLVKLFNSHVFTKGKRPLGGGGEASYWFPLIALLSGARLNEIAQLRPQDIKKDPETDIWYIDIDTDGGRSIKTVSSRRKVPLHPELIRLGLLKYREEQIKRSGKNGATLWPNLKSADEAYRSAAWTKWFGRYLRETVGITDPGLVFHSFRHTFKRLSRNALVPEDLGDFLTGHAGNATVGRAYGDGFALKPLAEAMKQILAPVSVRALPQWQ